MMIKQMSIFHIFGVLGFWGFGVVWGELSGRVGLRGVGVVWGGWWWRGGCRGGVSVE